MLARIALLVGAALPLLVFAQEPAATAGPPPDPLLVTVPGLTPVIIANEIEWAEPAAMEAERAQLAGAIEQWRADWQSRDTDRYLAHYSERFASGGQNLAAWAAHKRKVNAAKQWIKVGASRVAMFRYPRERDFVVVTFDQDYRSDGLSNVMRKRQYWVKEGASWKIIYEGAG